MPECLTPTCLKPLGDLSLQEGYSHCHVCRKCSVCGLDTRPVEIAWCVDNNVVITHARCLTISPSLTPAGLPLEAEIDLLNLCRLLIWPDPNKSSTGNEYDAELIVDKLIVHMPNLEDRFLALRKMQSAAARLSLLLRKDSTRIKQELDNREAEKFKSAAIQASTSSKPISKPSDDTYEILLATFMKINSITDRKIGLKKWKDREKAIQSFLNLGLSRELAEQTVDKQKESIQ